MPDLHATHAQLQRICLDLELQAADEVDPDDALTLQEMGTELGRINRALGSMLRWRQEIAGRAAKELELVFGETSHG